MNSHNNAIKNVTCINIGMYEHALTKGKVYTVFNENIRNYRIEGNHGKRVWISKFYFIEGSEEIPLLVSWNFDDDVSEDLIDVTFSFSDGTRRWAIITTPEKLVNHFNNKKIHPPGINIHHLIILRSLNEDDVNITFKYMDQHNKLTEATLQLKNE